MQSLVLLFKWILVNVKIRDKNIGLVSKNYIVRSTGAFISPYTTFVDKYFQTYCVDPS